MSWGYGAVQLRRQRRAKYARSGTSVLMLRPGWFRGLASLSADAPAGGTAGVSSHADTIHHVHTGAACFADWCHQFVWLIEGYDGWQSLC